MSVSYLMLHVGESLRPFDYLAEHEIRDADGNLYIKIKEKLEDQNSSGRCFEFMDNTQDLICVLQEKRLKSPKLLTRVSGEFLNIDNVLLATFKIQAKNAKRASFDFFWKEHFSGEYEIDAIIPSSFSIVLRSENNEVVVKAQGSTNTDCLEFEFEEQIDENLRQLIVFSLISISIPRGLGISKMLLNQKAFTKDKVEKIINDHAVDLSRKSDVDVDTVKSNAIIFSNFKTGEISNKDEYAVFDSTYSRFARTKRNKSKSSSKKKMLFAPTVNESFEFLGLDEEKLFDVDVEYKLFSNNKTSKVIGKSGEIFFTTGRKSILRRQVKILKDGLVVGYIKPLKRNRYIIRDARKNNIGMFWVKNTGFKNLSQSMVILLPLQAQTVEGDGQINLESSLLWTIYAAPKTAFE